MELLWNTLGFPFTDFILLFWLSSCLNMNVFTIFLFSSVTYALIYCTLPLGIGPTCVPSAEGRNLHLYSSLFFPAPGFFI